MAAVSRKVLMLCILLLKSLIFSTSIYVALALRVCMVAGLCGMGACTKFLVDTCVL